ncbi:MAG: hypothetical protein M1829_003149 [Trizodia sp. TS-e1964]|nr:MAG: hypothetical protein M1829_003149 [Trizodia sp. TS-e1964]
MRAQIFTIFSVLLGASALVIPSSPSGAVLKAQGTSVVCRNCVLVAGFTDNSSRLKMCVTATASVDSSLRNCQKFDISVNESGKLSITAKKSGKSLVLNRSKGIVMQAKHGYLVDGSFNDAHLLSVGGDPSFTVVDGPALASKVNGKIRVSWQQNVKPAPDMVIGLGIGG